MKRIVSWFFLFLIIMLLVLVMTSNAQVYSAQASKEIVIIVQNEMPMVKVDTILSTGFRRSIVIKHELTYPKAILLLMRLPSTEWPGLEWDWHLRAYTRQGQQVILRPEDEYAILEKIFAK